VLAAGRSSRMGSDKALLEVDGIPLWQRQRDLLRQAGAAEVWLSARPDQPWARQAGGFAGVLHDALPGCGPLVGLTAALERCGPRHVAAVAIDLPALGAQWFSDLAWLCGPSVGAIGRRGEFFEPLAAIYPTDFKWRAWEALARSEYALQPLVAAAVRHGELRIREIRGDEEGLFHNWNERTPDRLPH
jgi:molybdenum cofactor guanylyltransferase